jgi:hypothetical protein
MHEEQDDSEASQIILRSSKDEHVADEDAEHCPRSQQIEVGGEDGLRNNGHGLSGDGSRNDLSIKQVEFAEV